MSKFGTKNKNNLPKTILVFVGVLAALLLVYFRNPHPIVDQNTPSEDQVSVYKTPEDVLTAKKQAETTGLPVLGIRANGPSYTIPILMYHYVEHVKDPGDKIRISLNTLPETLDHQITTLFQAGYTFITASELADIIDGIKPFPSKPIMLTFDDGYRDFYTDAFPVIKKHQIKTVAYVVSGFLNRPNYLTEAQLVEIAKSPLVEIGAHTVNHLALGRLSPDRAKAEIENSKLQLEKELNISVTAFAYPYGSFDLQAIQLAKRAGFRTAVSTIPGTTVDNSIRYFLHRLRAGSTTGPALLALINRANQQAK